MRITFESETISKFCIEAKAYSLTCVVFCLACRYATLLTSGAARPALPRFNRYVSVTPQRPLTFVALGGAEFTPLLNSLPYLREAEFEFESVHFSHLIAGDLNRVADRATVRSLLTHLRTAQHSRLGLIDCSGTGATNRAVRAALAVCGERLAKCNAYVTALLDLADGSVGAVTSSAAASATGIDSAKFDAAWQSAGDVATTHEPLCRLWRDHVVAARTVLLTNGRQLVLDAGDRWSGASDWAHLEAHEHRHAALIDALEATPLRGVSADELTTRYKGDLLLRLMSIFGSIWRATCARSCCPPVCRRTCRSATATSVRCRCAPFSIR
jgi:hypothetical protein